MYCMSVRNLDMSRTDKLTDAGSYLQGSYAHERFQKYVKGSIQNWFFLKFRTAKQKSTPPPLTSFSDKNLKFFMAPNADEQKQQQCAPFLGAQQRGESGR